MKRIMILGTGMAVLSTAIYLGSTLFAQAPATAPATPAAQPALQTKIALINLNNVVKNYAKFVAFQAEMKGVLTKYQEEDRRIITALEAKMKEQKSLPPTATAQTKDAIDAEVKKLTRDREDNNNNGKKILSEKSDQGMVTLYIEVYNAAKLYADARGIELVMHFNDALDQQEMWGPANIGRKLQAGACIPLYYKPAMDISPQVVEMLNQAYKNGQGMPAAAGTTPTSTTAPAH